MEKTGESSAEKHPGTEASLALNLKHVPSLNNYQMWLSNVLSAQRLKLVLPEPLTLSLSKKPQCHKTSANGLPVIGRSQVIGENVRRLWLRMEALGNERMQA